MKNYIEEVYNVANLAYPSYFQIQFISVNMDDSDLSAIKSFEVNFFRSIKREEKLQKRYANVLEKRIRQEQTRRESAKERLRITRMENVNSFQGSDDSSRKYDRISKFKEFIKSGPCFISIVCNRCLYIKPIVVFSENKHKKLIRNIFHIFSLQDNSFYICKTCAQKLNKNQIPCQAVCNNLHIYDLPVELSCIGGLERVLIARRLQFKKVTIMPKGFV